MSAAVPKANPSPLAARLLYAAVLLTCVRVWFGPITFESTAQAQIPDSGEQRLVLITQAKKANLLLGEIKQLLKSGTINVRMKDADN